MFNGSVLTYLSGGKVQGLGSNHPSYNENSFPKTFKWGAYAPTGP